MASGTTLRQLVDEVIVDLKQTIDDAEISPVAVGFWIITISNDILGKHINKRNSGAFLTTWTNIPVIDPTNTQPTNIVAHRKYIELPTRIFDFEMDAAIDYMAYVSDGSPGCPPEFEFVRFERTSPTEARMLTWHPQTTPTPKRPYFYRTGDQVVLLGVENINITGVEIGLNSTIQPINEIDIDAPFTFPEELMGILRRQLLDLGRFILMVPSGRENIGNDPNNNENGNLPTQKIASVAQDNQIQ